MTALMASLNKLLIFNRSYEFRFHIMRDVVLRNCPLVTPQTAVQPRYLMTRKMTTQVNSMPPIMMNLSWVARFSISLITVFDKPSMLATSSIFLWVPCGETKQRRSHDDKKKKISRTARGRRLPWRVTLSEQVSHGWTTCAECTD